MRSVGQVVLLSCELPSPVVSAGSGTARAEAPPGAEPVPRATNARAVYHCERERSESAFELWSRVVTSHDLCTCTPMLCLLHLLGQPHWHPTQLTTEVAWLDPCQWRKSRAQRACHGTSPSQRYLCCALAPTSVRTAAAASLQAQWEHAVRGEGTLCLCCATWKSVSALHTGCYCALVCCLS